jgi:cytochrome c-type biogenesis protein CcmH
MTTGFIAAAVALLLVTLALLLRPWWWKARASAAQSQRTLNIAIHRDQLDELERDRVSGTLLESDYAGAKQEIQRRLIEDTLGSNESGNKVGAGGTAAEPRSRMTLIVIALGVPLLAGALYAWLGTPAALAPPAPQHKVTAEEVDRMVTSLAARMEKEPGNLEGWVMLARSYKVLNRYDDAAKAYGRAGSFIDKEPGLLADYADVLVASQRAFTPESRKLLERALKIDPRHGHALWLAGTDAFDAGKFDRAIELWQRVAVQFPPGSEEAQSIEGSIAEARAKGGKSAAKAPAKAAAAGGAHVAGTVELAAALREKVGAGDTVMVIARVAGGSRMPVAVVRAKVSELPLKFTLDDTLAMSPDHTISKAAAVSIEARISKTGMATAQPGDLLSAPRTVKLGATGIQLVVDQVRP